MPSTKIVQHATIITKKPRNIYTQSVLYNYNTPSTRVFLLNYYFHVSLHTRISYCIPINIPLSYENLAFLITYQSLSFIVSRICENRFYSFRCFQAMVSIVAMDKTFYFILFYCSGNCIWFNGLFKLKLVTTTHRERPNLTRNNYNGIQLIGYVVIECVKGLL